MPDIFSYDYYAMLIIIVSRLLRCCFDYLLTPCHAAAALRPPIAAAAAAYFMRCFLLTPFSISMPMLLICRHADFRHDAAADAAATFADISRLLRYAAMPRLMPRVIVIQALFRALCYAGLPLLFC